MAKRILDVGQCGVDGPRMGRFLREEFECVVDRARTQMEAEALASATKYDLALVNRVLDWDRSLGVKVIAALKKTHPQLPVMLVSDRADAQDEAVKLGALRGFGKSVLETDETEQLLRSVLDGEH